MIVSEILSPEAILTSINASSKKRVLQEISIAAESEKLGTQKTIRSNEDAKT